MAVERRYTLLDKLCLSVDQALRTISTNPQTTRRPYPAAEVGEPPLTREQCKRSAALMRVNHAGEVCAQALYYGQGLAARDPLVKEKMQQAALEEGDHLAWCNKRLVELGSHTSYLNPIWYTGALSIGWLTGRISDNWSLGFLAETETQVMKHLEKHLAVLPKEDQKSQQVLQQMHADEMLHRDQALQAGAIQLPRWVKRLMQFTSAIMTKTAYWV